MFRSAAETVPSLDLPRSAQHRVKLRSFIMLGFVSFNSLLASSSHHLATGPLLPDTFANVGG